MEKINCLRCNFRHTYNGNCTAVLGFCTAVPAAHCPLLREYLDTGLEPEAVETVKIALAAKNMVDLETINNTPISRLVELADADKDGRVVVLPCKVGDTVYFALLGRIIEKQVFSIVSFSNSTRIYCGGTSEYFRPEDIGKSFFLASEEAEKAMAERKGMKE